MYTLDQAQKIVDRNFFLVWDGWNIKAIDPKRDGYGRANGLFYNGQWCSVTIIAANKEGLYDIPQQYTRNLKTVRT